MAVTAAAVLSRGVLDTPELRGGEEEVSASASGVASSLPAFEDFESFGPAALDPPDSPRAEESSSRGDSSAPSTNHRIWELGYYSFLFDVSTSQVLRRLGGSVFPVRARLLPLLSNPVFSPALDSDDASFGTAPTESADFYGPLWILATLVALLPAAGDLGRYLEMLLAEEKAGGWSYDEAKLGQAASLLFGYILIVPLLMWGVLKWFGADMRLADIICTYGYSFFVLVPATLISIVPQEILRYSVFAVAAVFSAANLAVNFASVLRRNRFKPVLSVAAVLQAIFVFCCGFLFVI